MTTTHINMEALLLLAFISWVYSKFGSAADEIKYGK